MSRQRSPNYPAMSLPAAIEKVRTIQHLEGKNPVAREVLAKHLGFSGLNGASATALSALAKYGLLEPAGDGEAKVTQLALQILFPHDGDERQASIQRAAFRPVLFAKIREKWPDRLPTDDSLRSYLIREGFSATAADQVIQFYRETLEIAGHIAAGHDSTADRPREEKMMPDASPAVHAATGQPPFLPGKPFAISFDGEVLTGTLAITSARDIDRLMKVLAAQKAAFEAMQDDEDTTANGEEDDWGDPIKKS